jgi:hypothetical protein
VLTAADLGDRPASNVRARALLEAGDDLADTMLRHQARIGRASEHGR